MVSEEDLFYMKSNNTEASLSLMRDTVFKRRLFIKSHIFEEVAEAMPRLLDNSGQVSIKK